MNGNRPDGEGVLHLASVDIPGGALASWLDTLTSTWPATCPTGEQRRPLLRRILALFAGRGNARRGRLWLLLEQMHCFVYTGADVDAVQTGLSQGGGVAEFGLRGRLFFAEGQIEWRRLDGERFRLVVTAESRLDAGRLPAGAVIDEVPVRDHVDASLYMWGRRGPGGEFFDQQVGRSAPLDYPAAVAVAPAAEGHRPLLYVRSYRDASGEAIAWRLLPSPPSRHGAEDG